MNKLFLATAITASVVSASARGADLALKAPPPPVAVAPAWSWTGFYIGGNVGYGIAVDPTRQGSAFPDGDIGTYGTFNAAPHGALGGGQIGYNWQFDPHWVAGVEADWQWSGQRDSACQYVCPPVSNGPAIPVTLSQHLVDIGTARARFGYAEGSWLWYATGGFAWGRVNDAFALSEVTSSFTFAGSANDEHNLNGWTVGAGVETALSGGWSAKLEYLYVDLGSISDSFTIADPPGVAAFTNQSSIRDNIIRVGLNYNFGGGGATATAAGSGQALVYKATPPVTAAATNWTGFYLGGNAGYGVGLDPTTGTFVEPAPGFSGVVTAVNETPKGALAGGQIGYNWQFDPHWVLGAEADWQWSGQRDSVCSFFCASNAGPEPLTISQRLRDFGTARGRFGYAQNGWLWYATGGFAWGTVNQSVSYSDLPFVPVTSVSTDHDLGGWAVGGGVETALWSGWSAKLEYLYIDLGSISDSISFFSPGTSMTAQSNIRDNVVRVGLNYKFGWPDAMAAR